MRKNYCSLPTPTPISSSSPSSHKNILKYKPSDEEVCHSNYCFPPCLIHTDNMILGDGMQVINLNLKEGEGCVVTPIEMQDVSMYGVFCGTPFFLVLVHDYSERNRETGSCF